MSRKTTFARRAVGLMLTMAALAPMSSYAAEQIEAGKLTYGTAATFMPFEFVKDSKLTGFDIDLINALSKKLDLEPAPMQMEFKGLIPALAGNRIDIINSAMYINDTRAKQVDFLPYMKIGNRVVVKKGNPAGVTGRDLSLCGKRIAVTLGGIEESQAREDSKKCLAANKPEIDVMTFPTALDSAVSVAQGRADVEFLSTPGVAALLENKPGVFEPVGEEFEANTKIGMAVRKGDTAMVALLEKGLKAIVEDGTYDELVQKWDLPSSVSIFK